jgi:glycosyltransferase involved in cell wall biosynthesis
MNDLKVLLEMRPALDGHAGIPQETRLLFRGLAQVPGVEVLGLLQSGNLVVEAGLPLREGRIVAERGASQHIDRMSRVVVSLQQGPASHRLEYLRKRLLQFAGPTGAAAGALLGRKVPLTGFDAAHFKDFVWRAMFEKSLSVDDFETVTGREFRVMRWPWSMVNAVGVASAALGHAVYPRLDTTGIDVMIVETPYPGRVSGSTRMVVRYHDAIPLLMPHTIKDRGYHRAMHLHALRRNAADGAWFACVSEATRQDLLSVLPQLEARSLTIPNMISPQFMHEDAPAVRVPEIVWSRKHRNAPYEGGAPIDGADLIDGQWPYLLMVSTIEPRKNHLALLDAWELLRANGHPHLNLVCVGGLGWDHEAITQRFSPWLRRGGTRDCRRCRAAPCTVARRRRSCRGHLPARARLAAMA